MEMNIKIKRTISVVDSVMHQPESSSVRVVSITGFSYYPLYKLSPVRKAALPRTMALPWFLTLKD